MNNFLKLFTVCFLLLSALAIQAQTTFGIRGGVNLASVSISDDGEDFSYDRTVGITIAMLAEMGMSESFSIQPELHYIQKGFGVDIDFLGYTISNEAKLNYLELPIHAKYKFGSGGVGGYLLAGPTLGYALSGTVESCENGICDKESIEFDEDDGFKRFEIGMSIGAGVTINQNIIIDVRYTMGLTNLNEDDFDDIKASNNGIQIGVGYMFGHSATEDDGN